MPSSARRPACVAKSTKNERLHLMLVAGGILFALAVAVVLLASSALKRTSGLGFCHDEAVHGVNALQVLRGEHAVYFPEENDGLEGMMAYAVALAISLLGRTMLAVRLPTALASAGTVRWPARARSLSSSGWGISSLEEMRKEGGATPWRGLLGRWGWGWSAGRFHRSDAHRAHGV